MLIFLTFVLTSEFYNQLNSLLNEDIQKTFKDFKDKQIMYFADYFPETEYGQYHIHSYFYKLEHYNRIINNFPGEIFKYVYKASLFDKRPFEHEFFLQITQSFSLSEILIVVNQKRKNNKQYRKFKNENQDKNVFIK
ncbi:unnamed protein product [Rotaria sp. Silwood2]|nr:unnamed protein product [Rotaria sp. Silwood2]CAF4065002.1 unnamed protein product [Rotaria sp. Silwood2]